MVDFQPGKPVQQPGLGYSAFIPSPIDRKWSIQDPSLLKKLGMADRYIGRLDAFSDLVNIDLFVKMHITKEATLSAKIEGTQTSVEEALMDIEDISDERRDDWEEVNNYVRAINYAMDKLNTLPLSSRLIRQVHGILLDGVRGTNKGPGTFRTSQNWIGGSGPANAKFVPPPQHLVNELMSDLEKLLNDPDNTLPELLKIALIHYQFETIHPFQDGNGRIGRLLIPLYLVEREILRRPVLYLSAYFEGNRIGYYEHLTRVRESGDLLSWFHFFLDGIIATATDGVTTFKKTLELERSIPQRLANLGGRRASALLLVNELFKKPIVDANDVAGFTGCTLATAYKLIAKLVEVQILEELPTNARAKKYAFKEYLALFS